MAERVAGPLRTPPRRVSLWPPAQVSKPWADSSVASAASFFRHCSCHGNSWELTGSRTTTSPTRANPIPLAECLWQAWAWYFFAAQAFPPLFFMGLSFRRKKPRRA